MQNNENPAMIGVPVTKPSKKHLAATRTFQGIPGIEVTPNGRLWACWYAGGEGEGPENYSLIVTSADAGESWSEPVGVVDPPGTVRSYDTAIWIDPLNRLWLFWSQCESTGISHVFDGVAGVWGSYTRNVESDIPEWSTPVRIANGIMLNKPTVLANGTWCFPTALWNDLGDGKVPENLKHERFSNVTISRDEGETFQLLGGADIPDRCYDEHMLIERKNGSLWMLVRTNYGIGESVSIDGGRIWSAGKDSGIPGPNSRFFIRRLQSGSLLLINHDIEKGSKEGRVNLSAFLSDDDGATWKHKLLLDERANVSYPDGAQDADGDIFVIYDRERYKEGEILLAKFNEDDIRAGKIISKDSFTRRVVDRSGGV